MSDTTLVPDAAVDEKTPRKPVRRRRRRAEEYSSVAEARGSSRWVVLGVLVALSLYAVGPLWWLVVAATKSQRDLYTTNGLWFSQFNLWDNVATLFTYQDGIFSRRLWNTVVNAGLGSLRLTRVALAAGYGIAKYRYRGRGMTMGLIIGSFLIPGSLMVVPSFILFVQLGLYDTMWAMILPGMFGSFSVYLA
jgi:multiple sugar transport system permease protein